MTHIRPTRELPPSTPAATSRTASPAPRDPDVRELALNTPLETVFLPGENVELFELELAAPLRVSLQIEAADADGDLAVRAQLYTSDGELVPASGVSGANEAVRGTWDVPAAGVYLFQLFGAETRQRTVKLLVTAQARPPTDGGGVLTYGQTRSGAISARGQRDRWAFSGQAGDNVLIRVVAPGADAVLALYGPGNTLLAQVDDTPSYGDDPELSITLPESGMYTVLVRLYEDAATGSYQIALERRSPDGSE